MLSDPPVGDLLKPKKASQAGLECGKIHIALSWHQRLELFFFVLSCLGLVPMLAPHASFCRTANGVMRVQYTEEATRVNICPHEHI